MKVVIKLQSCLLLCVFFTGCATYTRNAASFRSSLAAGHYETAIQSLGKARNGPARLLYLMENGIIAHYRGQYQASNRYFEDAERLSDRLFTRSLSREAASLITNDQVRAYRGEEFELAFINYYRALNYWYLDEPEDALVECRKANLKLDRYAAQADYDATYRNDAFIHYMTGLFYEANDELNDAYVSYRNALDAYKTYSEAFGLDAPEALRDDLRRVEEAMGYIEEDEHGATDDPRSGVEGELIVFTEIGFVPHKIQEEINLPIFKDDVKRISKKRLDGLSRKIAHRYFKRRHARVPEVEYWLRVAVPAYADVMPQTQVVRVSGAGRQTTTIQAEDLSAIAWQTFQDKRPVVLTRTVARALAKYYASTKAEKKNKLLGFLADVFAAATEAADTRSWVSLPRNVQIGRLVLPAGTHTLTLESLDARGRVIHSGTMSEIHIRPGARTFVNYRTYQ